MRRPTRKVSGLLSKQSQCSSHQRGQRFGAKGHGRRNYLNLPMREQIHDVLEANKRCPHCNLHPFPPSDEAPVEIDWRVEVKRVVHRRKSYHKTCRCPGVPAIITAPPPHKIIPK